VLITSLLDFVRRFQNLKQAAANPQFTLQRTRSPSALNPTQRHHNTGLSSGPGELDPDIQAQEISDRFANGLGPFRRR
jgi:hypothetical protein